jgi:hypothetical protein
LWPAKYIERGFGVHTVRTATAGIERFKTVGRKDSVK